MLREFDLSAELYVLHSAWAEQKVLWLLGAPLEEGFDWLVAILGDRHLPSVRRSVLAERVRAAAQKSAEFEVLYRDAVRALLSPCGLEEIIQNRGAFFLVPGTLPLQDVECNAFLLFLNGMVVSAATALAA